MPKVKQYKQKFRSEWLKANDFKDWIREVPGDSSKAYCCICKAGLTAKYSDLISHSKTKKHVNASGTPVTCISKFIVQKYDGTSRLEGNVALYLACHAAIVNCDHLTDMLKSTVDDSKVTSKLKMHRTKCSEIIKNVLGPHFENDLVEDIGDGKYSLLLDESNDISVHKMLGIVVIHFSINAKKVVSTFLNLVELEACDAESIVNALKGELKNKKLDLHNLLAIGTDNASVMIGVNNGVYQKLKKEVPSLILFRCVCHSLQLAVSHASSECLPRNLEFLIGETYKWFSMSSLRQLSYKMLYETINDGASPLKIPANCKTRWLSIECAVHRIISQWVELKTHFDIVKSKERCFTSEMLSDIYKDERNLAFLLFLHPILEEVQRVNKLFESRTTDKVKLLNDLYLLIKSVANKLIVPTARFDPLTCNIEEYLDSNPYLGYRFERKIVEMKEEKKINKEDEKNLRERSKKFLLCLYHQLKQRLPDNLKILMNISSLSVGKVLNPTKEPILHLLEMMGISEDLISAIEIQYNKIHLIHWENIKETEAFWCEVLSYKDASGNNPFEELSKFAISTLILPHSNADVERVFSAMNNIKSKLRNRMEYKMLTSLLTIKFGLIRGDKCCSTYQLPKSVLQKIGTLESYNRHTGTTDESLDGPIVDLEPQPSTSGFF